MRILKYGITLRRVTRNDIEYIRKRRNEIRDKMEYREYITPEMQEKWFEKINNYNHFYYLIEKENEKIGLISEIVVDREKSILESGLFLFDKKYHNTIYPVLASLILLEVSYYIVGRSNDSYIKILKDNYSAIEYNKALGYELCEGQENVENQLYVLKKRNFEKKAGKLRNAALKATGKDNNTYVIFEDIDFEESHIGQKMEELVKERLDLRPQLSESSNIRSIYWFRV